MSIVKYRQIFPYLFLCGMCLIWYGTSKLHPSLYFLLLLVPILFINRYSRLLAVLLLGCLFAEYSADQHQWRFPASQASDNHLVVGSIEGLPQYKDQGVRVRFKITTINHQLFTQNQPVYFRLSCYNNCPKLKADQKWQFLVRLKPANGYVNPQGFDYEKWLYAEQFKATGYIVKSSQNQLLSTDEGINTLRQTIRNYLSQNLKTKAVKGSAIALAIGDKSYLEDEHRKMLVNSGLSHLMAISGLHIGLSAIPGFLFAGVFWRFVKVVQKVNKFHFQWLVCLIPAICYTALSGFGLPAWRALVMLLVFATVQLLRISISTHSRFCIALWFILLTQPLAPLQISFWLSFAATALLILLSNVYRSDEPITSLLKLQAQLFVMLLPIQLLIFGSVSMVSPVLNFIAIPFVSFLLLPLLLLLVVFILFSVWFNASQNQVTDITGSETVSELIMLPGTDWILWMSEKLLQLFWEVLIFVEPYSEPLRISVTEPNAWLLLVYPLLVLVLLSVQLRLKLMIVLMLMFLLYQRNTTTFLRMMVLDVGQGLAITIDYKDELLVYDTAYGANDFAVAPMTLVPWLKRLGHEKISLLVVSHNDADHAGGLDIVRQSMPIKEMITGSDVVLPTTGESLEQPWSHCVAGQVWEWSALSIKVIYPFLNNTITEGNNSSCVLLLNYRGINILLTGDIETGAERQILEHYPELTADVLLVPHHGSNTSSTWRFVRQINPQVAIVSSGYMNRFNLPTKKVLQRYKNMAVKVYNTAYSGAVEVTIDNQGGIDVKQWRLIKSQLWRRH